MYFQAINQTDGTINVYTWNRALDIVATLPGNAMTEQVLWGQAAYWTAKHTLYLVGESACGGMPCLSLIGVETDSGRVASTPLASGINLGALAFDEFDQTLYGFVSSASTPAALVVVDLASGAYSKPIVAFGNFSSAGSLTVDAARHVAFASLDVLHKKAHPYLASIDVKGKKLLSLTQVNDPHDSFIRSMQAR